jgi:hypothetical protein
MKLIKLLSASAVALALSLPALAQNGKAYGKEFKTDKAVAATELSTKIGKDSKLENVVVVGEISEVCQAEGCWMKLKNEAGENIFVKFKDHAFLIPKDLAGHKAYVQGKASRKTVSVEDQKHYAEDAGKSDEEIARITEPKVELRIDATGVIIE